jgi:hypothetical protein
MSETGSPLEILNMSTLWLDGMTLVWHFTDWTDVRRFQQKDQLQNNKQQQQ